MKFTRGDTQPLKFQRIDADGHVIMTVPDEMFFTVKLNYNTKDFVIQKTLSDMTLGSDGYWHFVINPEDTQELDVTTYVYDIEVTTSGIVFTISKGTLELLSEATWSCNK